MEKIINKFRDNQAVKSVWRVARWPLLVIAVLYFGLVIYRIPAVLKEQKTGEVVKKIHEQKLTLADVDGKHLPPAPDPALKDTALEGIDANSNGIRDDVELAIFKLHPDSARIRAAKLQYAMALQNEIMGDIFNSETFVAVIQQERRGFFCIGDAAKQNPSILTKEIENLVFNTTARAQRSEKNYSSYMTSIKSPGDPRCDIDLTSLPN